MSIRSRVLIPFGIALSCTFAHAGDSQLPDGVQSFLRDQCADCHEGDAAEAGFDVTALSLDLSDADAMRKWVRLHDRVADGEMPPQDYGEVDSEDRESFLESCSQWIRDAQEREFSELGRVRSRRLNNKQLERTLHDLLAVDIPLADLLPEEQRTEGFNNVADGQSMSHFLLESHLAVVDRALDAAWHRVTDRKADPEADEFNARRIARQNPRRRCRDPEMIDGKAVVWSAGLVFYGRITSSTVRESGWYRITFSASSMNRPGDHGVWCTVRSGACNSGAPLMSWIGAFEAMDEPSEQTMVAWIPAGHMVEIRPGDANLKRAKFRGGQVGAGEGGPQKVPGVALHSMTMQRIFPGGKVNLVQQKLFGDLSVEVDRQNRTVRYAGEDPEDELVAQLRSFTRRAFRRPVSKHELAPYVDLLREGLDRGDDPLEALRASYRAILCSPRFLYFVEPLGELDDHAIASRLSYMLWGTMPDAELFRMAREGKLRDTKVLQSQVDRMLSDGRGQRFVEDLSSQWLDLVDIDFTEPDSRMYRDFDIVVQNSMLDETHHFLRSLLEENATAVRLVDSDFTFLNSRLARYYDIDGVEGDSMRRVDLPPESNRGGLMAQGAILKVTANGTNTSPVLRGIWVSERILGTPIPPPPENVPAVEPDIRGAKTIREQLQLHLKDDSCAGCHYKIDPPGYALENFDAAGQWRENYTRIVKGRPRAGSQVDASFTLPDGRDFQDFDEFRELLCAKPEPIARNFAEKLVIYGTGAPISFADRSKIEDVVSSTADTNYGLRSLLHAVVASPIFLNK